MPGTGITDILVIPLIGAALNLLFDRLASRQLLNFFRKGEFDLEQLKKLKFLVLTITAVLTDAEEKEITNPSVKWWLDELKDAVYEAEDVLDEISTEALRCELESQSRNITNQVADYSSDMKKKVENIVNRLDSVAEQKDLLGFKGGLGGKKLPRLPTTSLVGERVVGRSNEEKVILEFLLSDIGLENRARAANTANAIPTANENGAPAVNSANAIPTVNENGTLAANENGNALANRNQFATDPTVGSEDGDLVIENGNLAQAGNDDGNIMANENLAAAENGAPTANNGNQGLANEGGSPVDENGVLTTDLDEVTKILVVAIVGMPGIGKTTLAQSFFNNEEVKKSFKKKAWVHVSEEFNVLKITKMIYESVSCRSCHTTSLNKLQVRLQKALRGKTFLLVLDDIWNENFADWDLLKKPFKDVASGSRIIVTSRSSHVASIMRAACVHHLPGLSDSDCWSLFRMHAFRPEIDSEHPKITEIRGEIVKKCGGLPLVAKTLSAFLYSKVEIDEWVDAVLNEIWNLPSIKNNILAALKLSYYHLPPHLKRCFAYCSIFPKGYRFTKAELIQLWMAEGLLLLQPRSNQRLDDLGEDYFNELLSKSFFQESVDHLGRPYLTMHDLFSDLAKNVAGEFCFKPDDGFLCEVPEKVRHFSFIPGKYDVKFDIFQGANHLRTFLPLRSHSSQEACILSPYAFTNLLQEFSGLRVLSLQPYKINMLPESICKLRHLRYLNLSGTQITQLPISVGFLYNLETLLLLECENLTTLPLNMQDLINLQHLDIRGTKVEGMPPGFGNLKNMHMLTAFVAGKGTSSSISELKELSNLGGTLSLLKLENVYDSDAKNANLKEKKYLNDLSFQWDQIPVRDAHNEMHVLLELRPHEKLKKLTIKNYGGTSFPNWLGDASFSNMVCLHLIGCESCSSLPPLGQLSSLKELLVVGMKEVKRVGSEFCRNDSSLTEPFRSLETLKFGNMPNWRVWSSLTDEQQLLCLQNLHLYNCPNLTGNLPKYLPSLKSLHIEMCPKLGVDFLYEQHLEHQYKALKHLEIKRSCESLSSSFPLGYFTNLEELQIQHFPFLKFLEIPFHDLSFLRKLRIKDCPQLKFSPERSLLTPKLVLLSISNCSNLPSMPQQMFNLTSLHTLEISRCPRLTSFPEGGLPANLKSLSIKKCINLTPQVAWGLHNMTLLSHFVIEGGCGGIESFPSEGLLPSTLTSLQISELKNLRFLNHAGLQSLIFLQTLQILDCKKLECISDEQLPLSLDCLNITECPLMVPRCKRGGEDWKKICHISEVIVDGRRMQFEL